MKARFNCISHDIVLPQGGWFPKHDIPLLQHFRTHHQSEGSLTASRTLLVGHVMTFIYCLPAPQGGLVISRGNKPDVPLISMMAPQSFILFLLKLFIKRVLVLLQNSANLVFIHRKKSIFVLFFNPAAISINAFLMIHSLCKTFNNQGLFIWDLIPVNLMEWWQTEAIWHIKI